MVRTLASLASISLAVVLPSQSPDGPSWQLRLTDPPRAVFGARTVDGNAERAAWSAPDTVAFDERGGRLTFGPDAGFGVTSDRSFTLQLELRTRQSRFATALMCREGGRVHYSLVLGRDAGRLSFEVWSWARDRAGSTTRIDDGEWHRIEAAYAADSHQIALVVDGVLESVVAVASGFDGSPTPGLRLGDNLDPNVHQAYAGELRAVSLRPGVPPFVRDGLAALASARVLAPGAGEVMIRKWNDRHRPDTDPAHDATTFAKRRDEVRALVQDALGLWPAPGSGQRLAGRPSPISGATGAAPTAFPAFECGYPLDRRDGGSLERDGYRLTRVYWQTVPGDHASGWLYEPTSPVSETRRAAVLCPHGHWADGARHPVVQARCITLAKLGYVVLAVDSLHVYDDRVALTPVSAMTWANLRGLELLRARADVDPARIGCTGASGGGQQTYYLTALDSGLAAAAPAVMVCHLKEILDPDHVHCACNHVAHLARVVDVPEMSAAFAPRPQLFLSVTGDWTQRFPEEGFPAIRALYTALGADDRIAGLQWDHGHDYDRPMRNAMYAFFERWLHGVANPAAELEPEGQAVEELATLNGLDRVDTPRVPAALAAEFRRRLAVDPLADGADRDAVRARLARLFVQSPGDAGWREVGRDGDDVRRGVVRADADVDVPILRLAGNATAPGVAVVVAERGKADVLLHHRDTVDALRERHAEVWLADIRYTGELAAGAGFRDLHGRFYGLDEGQLAVADLRSVVRAVDVAHQVTVVAFGASGAAAVFAAALEPRIGRVVATRFGASYRTADRTPRLARVLLHGDLPEALFASHAQSIALDGVGEDPAFDVVRRARPRFELESGVWTPEQFMAHLAPR